jgi:hypothetical protein
VANGYGGKNGISPMNKTISVLLGGTGGIALLTAFLMQISNQASIAIAVAEQHGQELLILKQEIGVIQSRTADRYTSIDAARDMAYLQRRLKEIEDKIDRNHQR